MSLETATSQRRCTSSSTLYRAPKPAVRRREAVPVRVRQVGGAVIESLKSQRSTSVSVSKEKGWKFIAITLEPRQLRSASCFLNTSARVLPTAIPMTAAVSTSWSISTSSAVSTTSRICGNPRRSISPEGLLIPPPPLIMLLPPSP